jgi:methyl-accepting chemotaxis protein
MTIGKKIAVGFALPLVILVIVGGVSYWCTVRLIDTNHAVTQRRMVLEKIEALLGVLENAETGKRGFVITGEESYLEPYRNAVRDLDPTFDELRRLTADNLTQQEHLRDLKPLIDEKFAELKAIIDARRDKKDGDDKAFANAKKLVLDSKNREIMDRVRKLAGQIREEAGQRLKSETESAETAARVAKLTAVLGTLLAFVLVGLAGFLLTRDVVQRTRRLSSTVNRIAAGELTLTTGVDGTDEIGALGRAFDGMTTNLRNTIESEKGRRHRIEELLQNIRTAVTDLASAGSEISASTAQQAAGAQEQAAAVSQTVATVDEVTHTAEQSAQRARGVGEAVQRTVEVGNSGKKAVEDSLAAMGTVRQQVEATAENILGLAEQAQAIGDIIATVNDIAEQTNLLALNAAIEASRAGEHGRGFAVVAGEVKALADQSKKATAQVRQILTEIQRATNTAVLSTEEVTKGVARAIAVGGQAGETIRALADTLAEVARAAAQIVASVGQQATGMSQIHQAIRNIDQVAKQTAAATRQAAQAADNLNKLGTRLAALTAE